MIDYDGNGFIPAEGGSYNRWVDRVAWFDLISAKKAMEQFFADSHCAEIISKIDDKSIVTSHYAKVGSYGK